MIIPDDHAGHFSNCCNIYNNINKVRKCFTFTESSQTIKCCKFELVRYMAVCAITRVLLANTVPFLVWNTHTPHHALCLCVCVLHWGGVGVAGLCQCVCVCVHFVVENWSSKITAGMSDRLLIFFFWYMPEIAG